MSGHAIRTRCAEIEQLVRQGKSSYFAIDDQAIEKCAAFVAEECRYNYPSLDIPIHSRWRHFMVQNVDLWQLYTQRYQLNALTATEFAKTAIDLTFVSVLLDAGAGSDWSYSDPETGAVLARSEGLAAASMELFFTKVASSLDYGFGITAERLLKLNSSEFETCFQVSSRNPLVGIQNRIELLHNLGKALQNSRHLDRPGDLLSVMLDQSPNQTIDTAKLLSMVLAEFNSIWPNGFRVGGQNFGDVGFHSLLTGNGNHEKIVPFHKLSQWLCYSLIEPLQWANAEVDNQNALTALPEYRNGGLLLDTGVIRPKSPDLLNDLLDLRSEAVVEWRALTVSLIDAVAPKVRSLLDKNAVQLPLGSILQGGTWSAGRKIARQIRRDMSPPIRINFEGTIF